MANVESRKKTLDWDPLIQALEGTPVPTFVLDKDHRVTHWNHALEVVTGRPATEVVGTTEAWKPFYPTARPTMADLILDHRLEDIQSYYGGKIQESLMIEGALEAEDFFPDMPGGGRWMSFLARQLVTPNGEVVGAIETLRDITEQKRAELSLEDSLQILRQVIDGCPVPMFVINKNHEITHWNKACEAIIGGSAKGLIGTKQQWVPFYAEERPVLADLVLDSESGKLSEFYNGIWKPSPLINDAWEVTDYFPDFKTGPKWLYFTAAPMKTGDGRILGAVETLQDVTAQKRYEFQLEYQANHDVLTKLPNRNLLEDRLTQAIAQAKRTGNLIALLFIDLDGFKTVNDTLGHDIGDELLKVIAERIQKCVRGGDTVARLGGDEFVVLLINPDNEGFVADVATRIIKDLGEQATVGDHDLYPRCSIGVALYPQDGLTTTALLKRADSAMYAAKNRGRGDFRFFTKEIDDQTHARLKTEQGLFKALENDEFELFYQPLYDLGTGLISGAEALIRWRHPEKGIVLPGEFIGIAEEIGIILPIGDWVLERALTDAKGWQEITGRPMRLSVNVSPRQFQRSAILESLQKHFSNFEGTSLSLDLEVTESIVMSAPSQAIDILKSMKAMGVQLAMDDFGTGHSSLAYLRQFPFDKIKVDRSFIQDAGTSEEANAIVRAILDLGKALNLEIVAEGVETEMQKAFLLSEGCPEVQGFLYSRPLPSAEFRDFIRGNATLPQPDQAGGGI